MMTTLCNALGLTVPKLLETSTDAQLEVARCALANMIPGEHTANAFDAVMREIHRRRAGILPGHSGVCSPAAPCGKCMWIPEQERVKGVLSHPDAKAVKKCHALWRSPSSITGVNARHVCKEPMGHAPPCRCTCKAESHNPAFRRPHDDRHAALEDLDLGPLPMACELCNAPCSDENGVICGACRRKGGGK